MDIDDHSIDRWLRFAPWAAAVLAGLCLIAMLARVALDGRDASSEPPVVDSSSDERAPPAKPIGIAAPQASGQSDRSAETSVVVSSRSAGRLEGAAPPKKLTTPNSKSRITIYGGGPPSSTEIANSGVQSRIFSREWNSPLTSGDDGTKASAQPAILGRLPELQNFPTTSFFGIEATGRRFVYVLDRSLSMGDPGNKPLRAAKEELIKSLERLDSLQQFVLIFYNQDPSVFAGDAPGRVPFATDLNKAQARNFIQGIAAEGGTDHYHALAKALKLNPDVIFMLTDGEQKDDLTPNALADLRRMNRSAAQIHVIQFASSPYARNSLVRLAEVNRGQHTYVDIRSGRAAETKSDF